MATDDVSEVAVALCRQPSHADTLSGSSLIALPSYGGTFLNDVFPLSVVTMTTSLAGRVTKDVCLLLMMFIDSG